MDKNKGKIKISTKNKDIFRITLTEAQKPVVNSLREKQINILVGGAGLSKDTMSLYRGLDSIVKKEYDKLVLFRPLVQAGNNLGYLKGDLNDKKAPYEDLYLEHFNKIIDKSYYNRVKKNIHFETEQFVRGKTFEYSYIAVSEAQNYTLHELITIITRVASSSVIVLNGDPQQSDIGRRSGLKQLIKILDGMPEVSTIFLGDEFQMRNPIINEINKRYYKFLNESLEVS